MENANIDDTQPRRIPRPAGEGDSLDPFKTLHVEEQSQNEAAGSPAQDETQAVPVEAQMEAVEPEEREISGEADEAGGTESLAETLQVGATPPLPLGETLEPFVRVSPKASQPPTRKPPAARPAKKKRPSWIVMALLGLLGLFIIAAFSGFSGYLSGISLRQNAGITQVAQVAKEQFDLGVQDLQAGQFFRARQRFEYVIQIDPAYPGAVENLAEVLLYLNTTATPTLVPTPTLSPTPDLRNVEDLFSQAEQALQNSNWASAIDTLLALRQADAQYRIVDVDGMLFIALRNSGDDKILKDGDLEGGIYDLTLAARFGPMDAEAKSLLNWSTLYITGASFWEIDWEQAAYYFGQVAPYAPNLRDGSNMTAVQRYGTAMLNYAKQLMGQKRFCDAQAQLQTAASLVNSGEIQQALADATARCAAQTGAETTPAAP